MVMIGAGVYRNDALADLAAVHGNVADLTAALTDQR